MNVSRKLLLYLYFNILESTDHTYSVYIDEVNVVELDVECFAGSKEGRLLLLTSGNLEGRSASITLSTDQPCQEASGGSGQKKELRLLQPAVGVHHKPLGIWVPGHTALSPPPPLSSPAIELSGRLGFTKWLLFCSLLAL